MIVDKLNIQNIKGFTNLTAEFKFPESKIIVLTGKNGMGKTSIIKSFNLISDPTIFDKSSGLNSVRNGSKVQFNIDGFNQFSFKYNKNLRVLDTKEKLPPSSEIVAELPLPYGRRFQQFSLISSYDSEIRTNIAASKYSDASELMEFLSNVYPEKEIKNLKKTQINKHIFYLLLLENDYYIREDHLSSGEYFLIQLFRLITSGATLILIDELDVALDASAQVNLYKSIKPILERYESRLIVISHSLAFMNTVDEGGLYYLESNDNITNIDRRSFGYIKSDLYGFKGKDRFIITEDKVLAGFIKFLIRKNIEVFFEYEIIAVGGQPQIDTMATRNDSHQIFGPPESLLIFVDKDISEKLKYAGKSKKLTSPVDDIELYIWENRHRLLSDIIQPIFTHSRRDKDTAKTYWKKVINSHQKSSDHLYSLVAEDCSTEVDEIISNLKTHLCLVNS
ncbi:MAG: AAA family ATPase [Alteromonadaceae bacterium]|uniref:AAA family ATPase n=1 Tax=Marinobacter sp. TaxID=50741 RepID=UPI0029C1390F|nr:AAA family ATPase [Marinobacter sp.]MDX5385164.1 AAA family ATPase [Marinobacter sp.]MDX5441973.1 AAA family ATPase [Alteromonadaceae bacterium]MDX5470869.1 AAA family ATPase [Marinobacter sp.]